MPPCRGLDFTPTQITRHERVSPIEITNGDFARESTIVVAMSTKVHGGSRRAMHKSNACVGQMGEVLAEIAISLRKLGNALTAPRRSLR